MTVTAVQGLDAPSAAANFHRRRTYNHYGHVELGEAYGVQYATTRYSQFVCFQLPTINSIVTPLLGFTYLGRLFPRLVYPFNGTVKSRLDVILKLDVFKIGV